MNLNSVELRSSSPRSTVMRSRKKRKGNHTSTSRNSFPENRGGKWKIDIFEKSMPKGNWATDDKKLRKQIYKHGRKCYRGKGRCLNPKK